MDKGVFRACEAYWYGELLKKKTNGDIKYHQWIQSYRHLRSSLSTHRLEALNEEVDSDYDADDYLPLETLHQKLNTAENRFSEVLPTPDLVKSENTS
ncbi:hypothetical protein Trydic_g14489 [Trypoxylus dichotomus]